MSKSKPIIEQIREKSKRPWTPPKDPDIYMEYEGDPEPALVKLDPKLTDIVEIEGGPKRPKPKSLPSYKGTREVFVECIRGRPQFETCYKDAVPQPVVVRYREHWRHLHPERLNDDDSFWSSLKRGGWVATGERFCCECRECRIARWRR